MKKLLAFILFFTIHTCFSQDLTGKWYMVNRSGLIEFDITVDSIKTRKLFTDFTTKEGKRTEESKIQRIVKLEDRTLIITKFQKDTSKYTAMALINIVDNKHFQTAWNVTDTFTDDIETLIQVHQDANRKLYGYSVYSEHFVSSLKQMKPIEEMLVSDFKQYLTVYFGKLKLADGDNEKYIRGYMMGTSYSFQMISQSFFELGFNPLQNVGTTEPIYKKYMDDPEVKNVVEEFNQK